MKWLNKLGEINGKVWVTIWSVGALVKFLGKAPIEETRVYMFLGVLGLFTGHKIVKNLASKDAAKPTEAEGE
jgi:hypothetical protein